MEVLLMAEKIAADANDSPRFLQMEDDDNDIASGKEVQVVICLNYVWDAGNTKWVRMTQP